MAPTPYRVTRSRTIAAPAAELHARINDFHRWMDWSPWEGIDPAMERTFSGPDAGVGATYSWSGNKKAGSGTMRILESEPGRLVRIALHFEKPFRSDNTITFTVTPAGDDRATVEWAMDGEHAGIMKIMSKFMSMDTMIGKDFEKGLAQLDAAATAKA